MTETYCVRRQCGDSNGREYNVEIEEVGAEQEKGKGEAEEGEKGLARVRGVGQGGKDAQRSGGAKRSIRWWVVREVARVARKRGMVGEENCKAVPINLLARTDAMRSLVSGNSDC